MSDKKEAPESAQIIQVPNTLRSKIGPGSGIDKALVRGADKAIAEQAGSFLERAREDVGRLGQMATDLEAATDPEAADTAKGKIYAINHELRGEAGSYGFKLMSTIANMLCRYLEALPEGEAPIPAIVRAHIDALRAIASGNISGDGGEVGQELVKGLGLVVAKLQKK